MPTTPLPFPKTDGRRVRGERTRQAVLAQAVRIAEMEGLEGLTFGGIAVKAAVPKSTLQVLFRDRETLQIQTLAAGAEAFAAAIRERLPEAGGAFERLAALCGAWFDVVGEGLFPGGCLVTAAVAEYRARPGAIQAAVAEHRDRWRAALTMAARAARQEGALAADLDIDQLVFEILALQGAANAAFGDSGSGGLDRARQAVKALLARSRP